MNVSKYIATIALVALPGLTLACKQDDRGQEGTPQSGKPGEVMRPPADESGATFTRARDEFVAASKQRIARLDQQMADAEKGLDRLGEDAKVKVRAGMDELRTQRKDAEAALERAQTATASTWDDVKAATDRQVTRAEDGFNSLLESMKVEEE